MSHLEHLHKSKSPRPAILVGGASQPSRQLRTVGPSCLAKKRIKFYEVPEDVDKIGELASESTAPTIVADQLIHKVLGI